MYTQPNKLFKDHNIVAAADGYAVEHDILYCAFNLIVSKSQ